MAPDSEGTGRRAHRRLPKRIFSAVWAGCGVAISGGSHDLDDLGPSLQHPSRKSALTHGARASEQARLSLSGEKKKLQLVFYMHLMLEKYLFIQAQGFTAIVS